MDTHDLVVKSERYASEQCKMNHYEPIHIPAHFRNGARWGYEQAVNETAKWIEKNIAVCTPGVQKMLVNGYKRMMLNRCK